jgi:serralysin
MAEISFDSHGVDFTIISTTRNTTEATLPNAFEFDSANGTDVDIGGTGFTYDGASELKTGIINSIDIDLNGDQSAGPGDITISGLSISAARDLGTIDDNASYLFGAALEGDDNFDLSGITEDPNKLTPTSCIFGDDLRNTVIFLPGTKNTNSGGDDSFIGADTVLDLSGDVWSLSTLPGYAITSVYNGGDDDYVGGGSLKKTRIVGDAWTINRAPQAQMTLNGGDDTLYLFQNKNTQSIVSGDVYEMKNGVVNGGDDLILSASGITSGAVGDVWDYSGGTLNGGDDTITFFNIGRGAGDVFRMLEPTPDGVFTVTGGDDELHGGGLGNILAGDIFVRVSSVDNLIVGGDDVIFGSAQDDQLYGEVALFEDLSGVSGGDDILYGAAGNDQLYGQTGDDRLEGGKGNDRLDGGAGNDVLIGGVGNDTAEYDTATAGVTVSLAITTAQATGGAGVDTLSGFEQLSGSAFNDLLSGSAGDDFLWGKDGNDKLAGGGGIDGLDGGNGDDTLNGGDGDDTLTGGIGADRLFGNLGKDVMEGGGGADQFLFNTAPGAANADIIADFSVADDTIMLDDAIFGLPLGALGAGVLRIGAAAADADDRIIYNPNNGALIYDANGNAAGGAALIATLAPGLAMTPLDFVTF